MHLKTAFLVLLAATGLPASAIAQTAPVPPKAVTAKAAPAKPAAPPAAAKPAPAAPAPLPAALREVPTFAPPKGGLQEITFWQLAAFTYSAKEPYEPSPHAVPNAVPDWIKALNGKKVVIRGNATPTNIDVGGVSEFFLANQTDPCGFGTMPRINEWIYVRLTGGKRVDITAPAGGTVEVLVKGTFNVKEDVEDDPSEVKKPGVLTTGHIVGLFSLVADSVQ